MTHPTQDKKPSDDTSWPDWGMMIGAAIIAGFIGAIVELCRLPVRLWRSIK